MNAVVFKVFDWLSKKKAFKILVMLLLLDVIVISFLHVLEFGTTRYLALNAFITPTEFHQMVMSLFKKVESDKQRFWKVDSALQHLDVEIELEKIILRGDSVEPKQIFYDPRLTIAVYLDELRRIGDVSDSPTLPFHWVDWVDVTDINQQIEGSGNQEMTCELLKSKILRKPKIEKFCKSSDQLSDEELESLGYRSREHLPKAVIYNHCPHFHFPTSPIRVFMAKSFAMTYLPKPHKVIILTGGKEGGTYEFTVQRRRNSEQRLLHSGMTERFIELVMNKPIEAMLEENMILKFNPSNVYSRLLSSVSPRVLKEEEDIMGMRLTIKNPTERGSMLTLNEKHFDYPKEAVEALVKEYELREDLAFNEMSFLASVKSSANYDSANEPQFFKGATVDRKEKPNKNQDWGQHYDWRFYNHALLYIKEGWTEEERIERGNIIIERLLRNWNRFAEAKGIVSWIMHGPLLSWYWNGLTFPYDVDIDIQVPVTELVRLAHDYNQTLVVENPAEGYGRFLIEVGTYIHKRDVSRNNYIDARFIDVDSGMYIDITGLAKSSSDLPKKYEKNPIVQKKEGDFNAEVYNDRRDNFYTFHQLLPLYYSMLNGVPVFIPHDIHDRLRWKYGKGVYSLEYKGWYFVRKLHLWIRVEKLKKLFAKQEYTTSRNKFDIRKMIARVRAMSNEEALCLLEDDDTLATYYYTSKFTDWHLHEKSILLIDDGKDAPLVLEDTQNKEIYDSLLTRIKFSPPMRQCLFEYEAFNRAEHHQ